jgi:Macrocin-O-methyltransferase (TylF)
MDLRADSTVIEAEYSLARLSQQFPGSPRQRLHHSPLFMPPAILRRIVFFDQLYRRILTVPGVIIEFGVRFGRDLAVLESLRTLYEPLNSSRTIVGFDTFTGFPAIDECDGTDEAVHVGALATCERYQDFLTDVLATRERMNPFAHIRKFDVRAGDASEQLAVYLDERPQTIVALAYFDMDLYEPTKQCLQLLQPHITRGTVIGFDELNSPEFPGETLAVREVLGVDRIRLQRTEHGNPGLPSFMVVE